MHGISAARAIRQTSDLLRRAGVDSPGLDARMMVMRAAGLSREDLLREPERTLTEQQAGQVAAWAARRAGREPLARIFGSWNFRGLEFALSADTLVPRPETEMLVEEAVRLLGGAGAPAVLDLGTGSGCILVSILNEIAGARGIGTDISAGAIATARANAQRLGVGERARFVCTAWTEGLDATFTDPSFDLVVSNPPYIESADIAGLAPEVREHDPVAALDGGRTGWRPTARSFPPPSRCLGREAGWSWKPGPGNIKWSLSCCRMRAWSISRACSILTGMNA